MEKVSIIGLDLAKRSFQGHGALADGGVAFRKKLSREKVLAFLAEQSRCVVAMEACGGAHHWGRAIRDLGHEVRLIPPAYVKPFVKRQKNDAADAEAICEAASRPTMRFVAVKTEEQQARAMLFRTRDLLVRQRTQLINALRGHLSEHGVVAPRGPANVKILAEAIEEATTSLPLLVVELSRTILDQIDGLSKKIAELEKATAHEAARGATTCRLQTMPGVGPITAMAIETFAPPMDRLQARARFRRLARACSAATFDRRQAGSWKDLEDGTARHPAAADHRRDGRRALGQPEGSAGGNVAPSHADAQAAHARGDRARQQDGAFDLGDADEGRGLPGSRGCDGLIEDRSGQPRERRACEEVDER